MALHLSCVLDIPSSFDISFCYLMTDVVTLTGITMQCIRLNIIIKSASRKQLRWFAVWTESVHTAKNHCVNERSAFLKFLIVWIELASNVLAMKCQS